MPAVRGFYQVLDTQTTLTTTANSANLELGLLVGSPDRVTFILSVSGTITGTSETLDVYLQHSPDNGTTYYDFLHFTQVTTTAVIQAVPWSRQMSAGDGSSTGATVSPVTIGSGTSPALAAGKCLLGPINDGWIRVRYVLGGTSPSYGSVKVLAVMDKD